MGDRSTILPSKFDQKAKTIANIQTEIKNITIALVKQNMDDQAVADVRAGLADLASAEMAECESKASSVATSLGRENKLKATGETIDIQATIIVKLENLLRLLSNKGKGDDESVAEKGDKTDHPVGTPEWIQEKKEKADELIDREKKILKMTQQLRDKGVDNWDDDDKKTL